MTGINQVEFEKAFNSWYEPIRNFIYYKSGDISLAEDIAQDAFVKLWEKRTSIIPDTIKSLLYTIANNLYLNKIEHGKVELKFVTNYTAGHFQENPHYLMEVKEFDNKLQKAISQLDEKKRTVFLMNRIEKLTYNQIAENLGITVKAVEKRMEKALAYLKKQINMNI